MKLILITGCTLNGEKGYLLERFIGRTPKQKAFTDKLFPVDIEEFRANGIEEGD